MSAIDFEYAIKKDVRNNPIVREIDAARQRQLLQTVVIVGFLVARHPVLGVAAVRAARARIRDAADAAGARGAGRNQPAAAARNRDAAIAGAVEHIATKQLHLVAPTRDQAIILERVTPSAPPEKSIVAAR